MDGEDITRMKEYMRNRRIGRVYQNTALGTCPSMTILENMSLADNKGKFYGLGRGIHKGRKEHYRELLRQLNLGLEDKMDVKVGTLSGGQRQRVAFARALAPRPQVLLLDEPLGALDAFTRMRLQDELIRIWQWQKNTMLMITHDIDEAVYLAQKVIILTPRPSRIQKELAISLPYPRDRTSSEFVGLRNEILETLHFV